MALYEMWGKSFFDGKVYQSSFVWSSLPSSGLSYFLNLEVLLNWDLLPKLLDTGNTNRNRIAVGAMGGEGVGGSI